MSAPILPNQRSAPQPAHDACFLWRDYVGAGSAAGATFLPRHVHAGARPRLWARLGGNNG